MKNKLIVMGITFIILIALTPLIFGRLMNAKFNQMLAGLEKKGFVVKTVEDKSTYLKTDRVLEVTIPSKLLNTEGAVESVKVRIETQFKNMPVTDVVFLGGFENVILNENYKNAEPFINSFFKKYVKFTVVTPNFRDYAYRFENIDIKGESELKIEDIKGVLKYGEIVKNRFSIKDICITNRKKFIEIKNFKNSFEGNKNGSYAKTGFDVAADLGRFKVQINKVYSKTKVSLFDKADITNELGFKSLNISNAAEAGNFKLSLNVNGIESELLKKLAFAKTESEQNLYVEKLFENGFKLSLNSILSNVKIMKHRLGGYTLDFNMEFLPTKNIRQKLNEKNIDFINARLYLNTTPQMANLIMNTLPKSAFLFALAKKEKGSVILNLEFKKGKLYSEGQLVQ
ncbi:hypothetical protein [Nautilia sp.]